jgi:hypothetical protein
LAADAKAAISGSKVVVHKTGGEVIVSCGDRRMGCENHAGRGEDRSFSERKMLIFHKRANAFESKEGGVTFVHVIDGRAKTKGVKGANATDAEQHFLLDAHVEIASIELRGDGAMFRAIGGDIGVEQIKLNAPYGRAPHMRSHLTIGKLEMYLDVRNELDG